MIEAAGSRLRVFCVGFIAAAGVWLAAAPGEAQARTRRVPERYATIQAAVDAADAGDVIDVSPGRHCGATIDRPVRLTAADARSSSAARRGPRWRAASAPAFAWSGADGVSAASGTQIEGFVFDGRGVSAANLEPLGVGDHRRVRERRARRAQSYPRHRPGDHQHRRRSLGDRAQRDRRPDRVRLHGARCAAAVTGSSSRSRQPCRTAARQRNFVAGNVVNGAIPDGFGVFSMVGVFVFAADATVVTRNRLSIPDNPNAEAIGQGVLVDNSCCGQPAVTPGARNTVVTFNDGRASEIGVEIDGTGGENTSGLVLFGNLGPVVVEGALVDDGPRPRRPFAYGRRLSRRPMFHD